MAGRRLYGRLKRADAPVGRLAQEIAQRFGDAEAAARNFATLRSRSAPVEERRQALQVLAAQRRAPLVAALPAALDDPATRVEAIRAIAAFDDDGLGKGLIGRYAGLSGGEKSEAIETLASRRRYGLMLTAAIAGNVVPRRDVPAHIARQLRRVVGTGFTEVWGPVEQIASEERAFARYRGLLTERALGGADAAKGQEVFARTCASCHKMYGDGGTIGPDITGSNRGNLENLLSNVVTPNADVPDAYRMVHVTTRDGRSFAGNVAAETERQLTLRVVGQEKTVLSKADIQSREQTAVSLMPPGLLDGLTDREVLDLVAFLRTAGPVKPQAGKAPSGGEHEPTNVSPSHRGRAGPRAAAPGHRGADLPKAKITRVRIYRPPNFNPLFNQSNMVVTVETDIGITGIGEGGAKDTLEQCAGTLIGKNPFRIEAIWQEMYIAWFYPPGREKMHALGALDLALWDIKGKALKLPVHELLGGAARNYCECYATGGARPAGARPTRRSASGSAPGPRWRRATARSAWARATRRSARCSTPHRVRRWRRIATTCARRRAGRRLVHRPPSALRLQRRGARLQAMEEFEPYFVEDPVRDEHALRTSRSCGR